MTFAEGTMTAAGKRGPLKEARIGTLQKKILFELSRKRDGMSHMELVAEINGYVAYRNAFWLAPVYARHLQKNGELDAAIETL